MQISVIYILFPTDLPPNARLDNLASLLTLDAKNIDVEKLGADAIKEQQRINLKFSSDKVAVIPEDCAQRMLAGVSHHNLTARSNVIYILFVPTPHSNAFG